jgi:hypothetical protein
MPRKSEEEGWNEIGRSHVITMQHIDEGETETVTKVGVNEEPTFRASTLSKKVGGMTIRVLAKEDNRVVEGSQIQFASKKVKQIEETDGTGIVSAPVGTPHKFKPEVPEEKTEEKPSILKNFVDKLADRLNIELPELHKWDKITIGVAAFSVAFSIAALAIGLSRL